MGGGKNWALALIYAASGSPRLWRVLPDVDRVEAQGIVGGLGMVDGLGVVGGLGVLGWAGLGVPE
jgi:hypothetical protein